MDVLPIKKRQRAFLGRSKLGCLLCRARRIKCDGIYPCARCEKAGKICPGVRGLTAYRDTGHPMNIRSLVPGPRRGRLERGVFLRFLGSVSVQLGGYYDERFWGTVVSAASQFDQVFHGMLALGTLYFLPMSDIMSPEALRLSVSPIIRSRYKQAQEWYSQSVQESIASVPQSSTSVYPIVVVLVTTILYIYVELRQGHYASLEQLVLTAFAVVHSTRSVLVASRDGAVLSCLGRLLDFAFTTRVNGSGIPRAHWQSAVIVGHTIATDIGGSELFQIQFDFNNIQYDLDNITNLANQKIDEMDVNDRGVARRLQSWLRTVVEYEGRPDLTPMMRLHVARLRCLWPLYRARWEGFQRQALAVDWSTYHQPASQFLGYFESMMRLGTSPPFESFMPLYLLEMNWVPATICAVWHCRKQDMVRRCTFMLENFRHSKQHQYIDAAIGYLDTLSHTPYHDATEVELALFTSKPQPSLLLWQAHLISQHLLKTSGQMSAGEDQSNEVWGSNSRLSLTFQKE